MTEHTKKLFALLVSIFMLLALPSILAASGSNGGSSSDDDGSPDLRGDGTPEDNGVNDDDEFPDLRGDGTPEDNGIDGAGDRRRGADKPEDNDNDGIGEGIILDTTTEININEAMSIAQGAASGTVGRVEQEMEDGRIVWNVRVTASDGTRTDVRIDAETGNVIRTRTGNAEARERIDDDAASADSKISQSRAIEIAKGLNSGNVENAELEAEDGRLAWKVRLVAADGTRMDVRIDAETGNVIRLRVKEDKDKDGISDDIDSNTGKDTDKDNDGMDDSVDIEDNRSFFQKILSFFGLF